MRLTFWRVIGLSTLYVFAYLLITAAVHYRQVEALARTTEGDVYVLLRMPAWWGWLLVLPPALLFVLWIRQRASRSRRS